MQETTQCNWTGWSRLSQNKAWDVPNITHSHIRYQSERHWGDLGFFFPLTQAHKTVNDTHTRAYTPTHTVIQHMNADAHTPTHNEISHIDARHIHINFPKGEERQHWIVRWAVSHPWFFFSWFIPHVFLFHFSLCSVVYCWVKRIKLYRDSYIL